MRKITWNDVGTTVAALLMVIAIGMMVFMAGDSEVAYAVSGTETQQATQVSSIGTKIDTGTITVSGITDVGETAATEEGGTEVTYSTLKVTAYPIILAYYETSSGNYNFSDYVSLYPSVIQFDSSTDENGNVKGFDVTEDDLDAIRNLLYNSTDNAYTNLLTFSQDANGNWTWTDIGSDADDTTDDTVYVVGNAIKSSYELSQNADGSWTADVPIGSYLIIVSNAEAVDYNEAVVSVYYDSDGTIEEGAVNLSGESNTWLKATSPSVDKNIIGVNNTEYSTGTDHNSVNIGDTVHFQIVADPIPNYGGTNPVYEVEDILSEGLTLVETSIKVYVVNSTGTSTVELQTGQDASPRSYRQTITNNTNGTTELYFTFVLESWKETYNKDPNAQYGHPGGYTLNYYEGWTLYIEYDAILNENAEVDGIANTNEVTLTYSTDSRVTGKTGTDEDKTYTYTFDIDGNVTAKVLTKYGEETTEITTETTKVDGTEVTEQVTGTVKLPLEGAEFTLYTDSTCTKVYTNYDDEGKVLFNGTVTSDDKGQVHISGLAAGTYYLKETKAPTGYTLNDTVYQIQIEASYDNNGTISGWAVVISSTDNPSGTASSFTVTHSESGSSVSGTVNETGIANSKTTGLPSTGGYGTMIFTIIGCVVMIISAWFYLRCREKKVR